MTAAAYDRICYRTEQRDERVLLRHLKSGEAGYTFGCTAAGETVQVMLLDGVLDSWDKGECMETSDISH